MGLHYHTRICINYEKAHSTGTFNAEIENKLKHIVPQYPLPASLKAIIPVFDLDKSQTQVITFILIKRHRCHANRTILAIYQYKCNYIDNDWIVTTDFVVIIVRKSFNKFANQHCNVPHQTINVPPL